ncbi:unnamed protein product [Orchesella dallaii]|uniref:Scavenger receptor class B member 1 n=1 Tax=Orchesella dallaii TaxID=48710 RepID=A0ABP1S1T6_9HEXA
MMKPFNHLHSTLTFCKYALLLVLCTGFVQSHHKKGHKWEPRLNLVPGKTTTEQNYITYYMYNITNPDVVEAGGKPSLEEVGPYVYRETRRKFDVEKVSDSVLKYTVDRFWEFMPELSEGHEESDMFNVINIPMLILANKLSLKNLPTAFNNILVEELLEKGDTLVRRNEAVGNVIYHGMNVSIYTEILEDVLQGNVPPEFAGGLFALLKDKNGTQEGTYTIRSSGPKIGDILSYNGKTQLDYWNGDYCNKIEGTDGYFFRPGITANTTLKIFYPELCRSVYLKFKGEKNYKGLTVDKFSFSDDMLEDPRVNTELKCFCSKPIVPTDNPFEGCLKKGFVDYASCKQESPLLVSFPHFLHADDEYLTKIDGLKPDKDKHETEFLIEPKTGKILSGTRKFQFNIKLRPLHNVEYFKNTSFVIFPVFNTYRSMIVPESIVEKVKEDIKLINETGVEGDAEDYPQDEPEPAPETTSGDSSVAEPEPESEAEPGSEKKKLGGDDHDYRSHNHDHHDHDHNELGHGHVHGSQGRNFEGSSSGAGSVSKFEAVTWMITTLTSLGLVMNHNHHNI